jgi:hypothetical protein
MTIINNRELADTFSGVGKQYQDATIGQVYWLRQIYIIDRAKYILIDIVDKIGLESESRFQKRYPDDISPQDYKAQSGDKLVLERIEEGVPVVLEDGSHYADKNLLNHYVSINEDEPYLLDIQTASPTDRRAKTFKIIALGEEYENDEYPLYSKFKDNKHKDAYICILNVKQ